MGQTLTNGIYLPDEGEVRCYDGLASNWTTLDAVVGGYRAHVANENIHITSAERNKWDNGVTQAYVLRYASVSLTALGTVAFSALDNTDNIKIGDKVLDSEGKLFALTAVDTDNSTATLSALLIDLSKDSDLSNYYTKNETDTLLNDKADDSGVVHKTGNETKSGELTLNDTLNVSNVIPNSNNSYDFGSVSKLLKNLYVYHAFIRGQQQGDEYSPNARTNLTLLANRDTIGQSGCFIDKFRENTSQGTGSHILGIGIKENSIRYEGCRFSWLYDDENSGYVFALRPTTQGTNRPIKYELGNSASKWNTINGLNPGSLSLPNLSGGVDISSYFSTGTVANQYTAPADGWICLLTISSSNAAIYWNDSNNLVGGVSFGAVDINGSQRVTNCMIPANKNVVYDIVFKTVGNIISAKFFPCQGNI